MDAPLPPSAAQPPVGMSAQTVERLTKYWWVGLVTGAIWIIAGLVVLQFHTASIVTVGLIVGVVLLVAGIQELALASVSQSWKWLSIVLGVLFLLGGIYALVNPVRTFVALADALGLLFVLMGILWTIEAFATRPVNDLWVLGLIAGVMMVVLGFYTAGQFMEQRAVLLLTFVGIYALFHGFMDIIRAFGLKRLGSDVNPMTAQ